MSYHKKGNRRTQPSLPRPDSGYECPRCGNLTADYAGRVCENCGDLTRYCTWCDGDGGRFWCGEWEPCERCDGTGER